MAATTTEEFSFGTQSTVQLANQYDMSQSWTLSFDFTVSPADQSKSLTILSTDGLKMIASSSPLLPRLYAAGQEAFTNDTKWKNGGTFTCTMVYDSARAVLKIDWGTKSKTFSNVDFGSNVISMFTTDLTNPSLGSGWGISGGTFTGEAIAPNPNAPAAPVVPEPATATLSLLALAGLAARRRRK